jgi:hypothetical protein
VIRAETVVVVEHTGEISVRTIEAGAMMLQYYEAPTIDLHADPSTPPLAHVHTCRREELYREPGNAREGFITCMVHESIALDSELAARMRAVGVGIPRRARRGSDPDV